MKKVYVYPDADFISFRLTRDILGDSQPEPTEIIGYNDPTGPDDPFGN